MDMSSDAIEAADCMVYGVSLACMYKESANCRLEANVSAPALLVNPPRVLTDCLLACQYAHQQELDMIPLMITEGTGLPLALSVVQKVILWSDRFSSFAI